MKEEQFYNSKVFNYLEEFKKISDVIVANRLDNILEDIAEKLYTRNFLKEHNVGINNGKNQKRCAVRKYCIGCN